MIEKLKDWWKYLRGSPPTRTPMTVNPESIRQASIYSGGMIQTPDGELHVPRPGETFRFDGKRNKIVKDPAPPLCPHGFDWDYCPECCH